jgi:hypothetical protein
MQQRLESVVQYLTPKQEGGLAAALLQLATALNAMQLATSITAHLQTLPLLFISTLHTTEDGYSALLLVFDLQYADCACRFCFAGCPVQVMLVTC